MPLALRSSGLTPCEPEPPGECVMVSTHFAHREQRRTSTRGGAEMVVWDVDSSDEEVEESEEVRWA